MEDLPKTTPDSPRPQLGRRSFARELLETVLLIMAIYTLVNLATARFVVEGRSMLPSFEGDEYLIVSRFDYILDEPQRGDIVVFHYPQNPERDFIKRVIGLPGEKVSMTNGQVFINDVPINEPYVLDLCSSSNCSNQEWVLGQDEYFVLGDNRNASQDSSRFGPIHRKYIVGRAWIQYWPPSRWRIINHHEYGEPPTPTPTITPVPPLSGSSS